MFTSTLGSMAPLVTLAAATLIKATVLLVLVAIAAHLLRRRSAALRHLLWTLAIVGLVALPVLTPLVPFRLRVLPATMSSGVEPLTLDSSRPSSPIAERELQRDEAVTPPPVPMGEAALSAESLDANPGAGLDLTTLLAVMWLAGVILLLARFAMGLIVVRGIARRAKPLTGDGWLAIADRSTRALGIRSSVEFRCSGESAMPFACGLIRPTIVLPSASQEWTSERREAVLMHELAHISRGDLAMNTLSHFVRALYWFHPLAWLAAYRVRVEGERACDDAVLRAGALPSDYAEHLLSIVRSVGNTVPSAALAMARRSDFEGRLLAILEAGIPRGRLTRWRAAGMAAAFLVAVMPLAAMVPAGEAVMPLAAMVPAGETVRPLAAMVPAVEPAAGAPNLLIQGGTPTSTEQGSQASGAVAVLIETLGDANASVRIAAINSLGALEDPRAIAALAKALREDSDARVREAAAWALGEIDDSRAVPHLVEALKTERASKVREKIVRSLGEIDDPAAVNGIAAVMKDSSVAVRRAAVWALGELEDPSALNALLGMVRDDDAEVRKHTAEALGQLESTSAIDALTLLTRDADAEVRESAVSALGQLEDMRTLGALVAALKDADPEVRSQAADAIHSIEDIKSAPRALIDALADSNREVRKSAAHSLGSIGDEAAVPGLKRLTSDPDAEVRRAAAESLSDIGGAEAITALMALLKDQDPEIRRIAAEALGKRR